jgi:hypothetical protein
MAGARAAGRRPEVSIGDALRIMRTLNLPSGLLSELVPMLSLEVEARAVPDVGAAEPRRLPTVASTAATRGPGARPAPGPPPGPAPAPLPETPAAAARPTELVTQPPLPYAGAPPRRVAALSELIPTPAGRPRRPADLLAPERQRAVLSALCSSRRADGEIDVDAVVSRIAAGEAVPDIPRRLVLTTRLGVRLLVDTGAGMTPFLRDAERLVAQAEQLVGSDALERLSFEGSPLGPSGVGDGPAWDWKRYEELKPLPLGRPVLAVTDLGLGGRTPAPSIAVESWREFAATVRTAGSRLVLLVPYPEGRWPAALRSSVAIVRWDRTTSIRDAIAAAASSAAGGAR